MSPPKLLDQVRQAARLKHLSLRTEKAYVSWVRRFVLFHGTRHPRELGADDIRAFLSHQATERDVAASTQNQALAALIFLYRTVLKTDFPDIAGIERARKSVRLPMVLRLPSCAPRIHLSLDGLPSLIGRLLYGSGLRLLEALRLRVKDVDFEPHALSPPHGSASIPAPGRSVAITSSHPSCRTRSPPAVRRAAIQKRASCQTLRQPFATPSRGRLRHG
jgi:integrase